LRNVNALWSFLKYFPPGLLTWIKRHSSPQLRLWLRERFGGGYTTIPDTIQATADGRRFHIGPDLVYWPIYTGVGYEPEATDVMRRLLRAGDVVVDVGANFGWYATLFAQLVAPGRVYAFEPVPDTYARLLENLALNGMGEKVTTVQAAVSDAAGSCPIYTFERSSAYASLSTLGEARYRTVEVPKLTLDTWFSGAGVGRVDFLKCDTEGSELMVLKGARKLLAAVDAPIIFIELNEETYRAFGYNKDDVRELLGTCGYDRFYEVISARELSELSAQSFRNAGGALCAKGAAVVDRLAGTGVEIRKS
jgi:FkbM family methyltransferase